MSADQQLTEFISSQQTEYSERQQLAIDLGKALVQELNLEPGVDTLSRWIAHYITEQIATVNTSTGEERIEAEERCFNAIMKLWQHRYVLPNERSPFRDFVPIYETLQRLNPENHDPLYISWAHEWKKLEDEKPSNLDEAKSWLRMVLSIDKTARVLIESVLKMAALQVMDSNVQSWLERASGFEQDFDVQIITKLVGDADSEDELDCQSMENDSRKSVDSVMDGLSKESIERRIGYLDTFLELALILRRDLEEDLGKLTQNTLGSDK